MNTIRRLLRIAREVLVPPRLTVRVPLRGDVDSRAYTDIHFSAQQFLDRVRRAEGLDSFVDRLDSDGSMTLKIGFSDHEAVSAISKGVIAAIRSSCERWGIKTKTDG